MDNVRILKGYSKAEQKELKKVKEIDVNDFLHIITGLTFDTKFDQIWKKYNMSEQDKRISIIRDILDFYTDKAKFPEQKYYVQLIKNNDGSYLKRDMLNGFCTTDGCQPDSIQFQTEFTEQEIKDIDPRYMAFAVPVEDDNG